MIAETAQKKRAKRRYDRARTNKYCIVHAKSRIPQHQTRHIVPGLILKSKHDVEGLNSCLCAFDLRTEIILILGLAAAHRSIHS
jgi:hypothetical protein